MPLYSALYSQKAPDFRSENEEIKTAFSQVAAACDGRGGERHVLAGYALADGIHEVCARSPRRAQPGAKDPPQLTLGFG